MSRRARLLEIAGGEPLMMRRESVSTLGPLLLRAVSTPGADEFGSPTRKALRRWALEQRSITRCVPEAFSDEDALETEPSEPDAYGVQPRVAVVQTAQGPKRLLMLPVVGPLDCYARDVEDSHGVEMSSSYERIKEWCGVVERDLDGLVMVFDTPGGSCKGLYEARNCIAELARTKPVLAFVPANCFSAGLVLATAASMRVLSTGAFMGSVGCMQVHMEISKMLADEGVGVNVIASNEYKATGNMYQPLSESGRAVLQSEVDELGKKFDEVLLSLPGLDAAKLETIKKEQTYCGEKAVSSGLADLISDTEEGAVSAFFAVAETAIVTEGTVQSGEEVNEGEDGPNEPQSPSIDLEPQIMSTANTAKGNAAANVSATGTKLTAAQIAQMAGGEDVLAQIRAEAAAAARAELLTQASQPATIEQLEAIYGENSPSVLAAYKAKKTEAQVRQEKAEADADRLRELEQQALAAQNAAASRVKLSTQAATAPVKTGAAGVASAGGGDDPYIAAIKAHPLYATDKIAATRAVYCERQDLYKPYAKRNSAVVKAADGTDE